MSALRDVSETRERPRVRWIVFDVGATLIDETRMWHEWADILGVHARLLDG